MKRIVVCLDGTWNRADHPTKVTNVVKIMRAIRPVDDAGIVQVVFYDKGVGTGGPVDRVVGGAFGRGLEDNIKDGYRFIANNYEPGDEIYLFGFSRGAFTARSLAGLIEWVGLIRKGCLEHLSAAYATYRSKDQAGRDRIRASYAWEGEVRIRCVGVWDTVGALGIPSKLAARWNRRRHAFHDVRLCDHVDHAFQALAIDELRGPFEPTLWQVREDERVDRERVKQVWFPGVHSDVGGSYEERGLADVSLDWMIREVAAATDLAFDEAYRAEHIHPDPLAPQHDSLGKYLFSRAVPYRRVLGGRDGCVGWLARRLGRFNRPAEGMRYVNEMIHRAALDRLGELVQVSNGCCTKRIEYRPPNLEAADGHLPVVEHDGAVSEP